MSVAEGITSMMRLSGISGKKNMTECSKDQIERAGFVRQQHKILGSQRLVRVGFMPLQFYPFTLPVCFSLQVRSVTDT